MQEACGRASTTSGFKGNKPATVNIAASLPDELNTFYTHVGWQHRPHRERSHGCCRRGQSTLPFCRGCNPILQTGEHLKSCGSGWHPRPCAQSMRIPTSRGFYRHFQSAPLFVCGSFMLQKIHHCAHTEEKLNHMLEWLEARCSDTHLQQVFWEARQRTLLLCAACFTGPTTICISQ